MLIIMAAQIAATVSGAPVDCLAPLTKEESRAEGAARESKRRAANLLILEPDEDLLPANAPESFKPALVILSYSLNADGTVLDCDVQKASKIASLDAASCKLLRRHHRVGTAFNSSSPKRIAVNWTPRVPNPERRVCTSNGGAVPISGDRWITSEVFSGPGMQSGSAFVALDVGPTGRAVRCVIRDANISKGLQANVCNMAVKRSVILPAVDRDGMPKATTLVFVVRFVVR
jgi:hypothetical protein